MSRTLRHAHLARRPLAYAVGDAAQRALGGPLFAARHDTLTDYRPVVLTAEFKPVYTFGRQSHIELARESCDKPSALETRLRGLGADVVTIPRGGKITFHGPGQLIVYPVLNLRAFGLSPRDYICLVEKTTTAVLAEVGVEAKTTSDVGVWVDDDTKIASVGVHVQGRVVSHGLSLNVDPDLAWFDHIVACGLPDKKQTSLAALGVDRAVYGSVEAMGARWVARFAASLGYDVAKTTPAALGLKVPFPTAAEAAAGLE
ncbi:uncharacterized protein V1510DRAFT_411080, partial [Dipodascopsis tothii]|uniref:uncharacterized protein n=1 Tax=Dipodascopsis tothii TaxID=44089 RepID=UPI0034CD9DB3